MRFKRPWCGVVKFINDASAQCCSTIWGQATWREREKHYGVKSEVVMTSKGIRVVGVSEKGWVFNINEYEVLFLFK